MTDNVRDFYRKNADRESARFGTPLQRIEFASTLRLIDTYFPATGQICDIGSGPGRYALELARRGYAVSLIDLTDVLLDRAKSAFADSGLSAVTFEVADARDLSMLRTASFDAALLLGPLYHITDFSGRQRALAEMRRVLKPGGIAIAAYLNTWGLIRTGIADFPDWYRQRDTIFSLLKPRGYSAGELHGFTEAYWATPPQALHEVKTAGFEVISYAGAEGFCGGMWPMLATLAERDPEVHENIVAVAAETCELPQYRDATDHLHLVIRRLPDG
jgi:S-adenosylmethionine-dependent methyltransferase